MISVEILPAAYSPDRWSATVVLDGDVVTTFTCPHGHKTPRTAAGCVDETRSEWDLFHGPDTTERPVGKTSDGCVVFEVSRPETKNGRFGSSIVSVSRRYSVRVADRCPTCAVPLTEPPVSDDCPIPEDHADLPPIDGDDTGPFSVEHVRPVLREDVDEWDYDRWEGMSR